MAQSTSQKTAEELRAKPRLKSLISATVVHNNGQSTLGCLIRNVSDTGAKLSVPAGVSLPDRFDLVVPQRNATYRAQIAWQRGDEIGVRFEGARMANEDPAEAALRRRIRELEAEVTRLKSRIVQLTEG